MLKDELLKLRSDIAKNNGQATYLVFNDKEMEMLLNAMPKTIDELSKVKGFPKNGKRVAVYGQRLVSIFNKKKSPSNATNGNIENSSMF